MNLVRWDLIGFEVRDLFVVFFEVLIILMIFVWEERFGILY